MTTRLDVNEILKQENKRGYMQWGGPSPRNKMLYAGVDGQYFQVDGLTVPLLGGIEADYMHDPLRPGAYRLVSKRRTAPDLPSGSLIIYEKPKVIPRTHGKIPCPLNVYLYTGGECDDLSDVVGGMTQFVEIVSGIETTEKDLGTRLTATDNEATTTTLSVNFDAHYSVGAMQVGSVANDLATSEIVDVVYGSNPQCGTCGPNDDGSYRVYALQRGNAYGQAPRVLYSNNGTVVALPITGIAANASVEYIAMVGDAIIVGSKSAGGYYIARVNKYTGITSTWALVTNGFIAGRLPNAVYVDTAREIYFAADGGAIYFSEDINAGVSVVRGGGATDPNLRTITGDGAETVIAGGEDGLILRSLDNGQRYAPVSVSPSSADITAVAALANDKYIVGTSNGELWFTDQNAETAWLRLPLAGATAIDALTVATREVWHVAYRVGIDARMATTWNGGRNFALSSDSAQRRINTLPVASRINKIAVPYRANDALVVANNFAIAALAGNNTAGTFALGGAVVL